MMALAGVEPERYTAGPTVILDFCCLLFGKFSALYVV